MNEEKLKKIAEKLRELLLDIETLTEKSDDVISSAREYSEGTRGNQKSRSFVAAIVDFYDNNGYISKAQESAILSTMKSNGFKC